MTCRPNLHLLLCHSQTMSVLLVVLKAVRYNWGWANHQVYTRGLFLLQTGNLWFEVHLLGQLRIEYKLVFVFLLYFYSWMCNFCSKVFSLCFFFPDLFPLERDYPGVTKNTLNPQNLFGKVLSKFPMGIHHAFRDQA